MIFLKFGTVFVYYNQEKFIMTVRERIIKRLNKGFGLDIPMDAAWKTHDANSGWAQANGAHSWYFVDVRIPLQYHVGSQNPASECLKWKRWIIDKSEREIFQYIEGVTSYDKDYDLLEKID